MAIDAKGQKLVALRIKRKQTLFHGIFSGYLKQTV
jgi:hypothetical protein